jgi:hypothetical protein
LGEIREYADFFDTFRRAVYSGFTTTKRRKQGFYVSDCLNKTTLQKNHVYKQDKRAVGKEERRPGARVYLIPMSISPLYDIDIRDKLIKVSESEGYILTDIESFSCLYFMFS